MTFLSMWERFKLIPHQNAESLSHAVDAGSFAMFWIVAHTVLCFITFSTTFPSLMREHLSLPTLYLFPVVLSSSFYYIKWPPLSSNTGCSLQVGYLGSEEGLSLTKLVWFCKQHATLAICLNYTLKMIFQSFTSTFHI